MRGSRRPSPPRQPRRESARGNEPRSTRWAANEQRAIAKAPRVAVARAPVWTTRDSARRPRPSSSDSHRRRRRTRWVGGRNARVRVRVPSRPTPSRPPRREGIAPSRDRRFARRRRRPRRGYASTSANVTRRRLDGVAPNGSRGGLAGGGDERARGAERALARGCGGSRRAGDSEGRARRAGVGRAGDRGDGRGASSSSGPTAASSEASKSSIRVRLLRNVVREAGGARGDVRGRGRRRRRPRRARRGAGGEVESGTAAARDAAGGGGGGRRRRFGGGGGFLRAHGNPGLPPALAPALVYLGQETHGGRRRGGAADDVPEISNSRTKRRTGRDDQPAAPRVPRRTRNLSARVSDDRVRSRQSRASVGRRRATRSELHPVGRGGGCPLPPHIRARRNLTTTISNYSASCSSARARRIKKKVDRRRFEARPRFVRKARALIGREQVSGAQVAATEGVQWQRLGRSGRWITRGATSIARAVGLRGALDRVSLALANVADRRIARAASNASRASGPGLVLPRARSSNFFVEARAARARGAMATPRPPARARTMDRTRPRPA